MTGGRPLSKLRGGGLTVLPSPWLCMDDEEYSSWSEANARVGGGQRIDRPCQECPLGFALEQRSLGLCNGTPSGAPETEEEELMEITRARAKPVQVDLALPSCDDCIHRAVCAIRPTLEGLDQSVAVELPALNAALTPRLTGSIDCGFYVRDKSVPREKPEPKKRNWTPEQRQAAADRLNAARRAKQPAEVATS